MKFIKCRAELIKIANEVALSPGEYSQMKPLVMVETWEDPVFWNRDYNVTCVSLITAFCLLGYFWTPKALYDQLQSLTGISQRDYTQYYDHISKQREEICRSIQEFFKKHIQYKFLDEDCKYLKTSINKGTMGKGRRVLWKFFKYVVHA